MSEDIHKAVDDVAYDYGVSHGLVNDSKTIEAAISSLISNMEYLADIQRADYKPSMWYEDRKFGGKREQANEEEKKERRLFEKRSRANKKKWDAEDNEKRNNVV
jgi:hypothetical protein